MHKLKGIILIIVGAISYGVLATFVKKANIEGLDTSGLNFLQYFIGFIALSILYLAKDSKKKHPNKSFFNSKIKLIIFGTTSGLTSYFYYLSIQYIPVSIAIILLMQTIWMGVLLEFFLTKKKSKLKFIGSFFVIIGTFFAVNVFQSNQTLDVFGLLFGILASLSYTANLYTANSISLGLPNILRSKYLVLGGLIIVIFLWNFKLLHNNDFLNLDFWKYGLFLGFFGAILPPIVFNKGFPIVGIGLGSILTSIEIPVSIITAHLVLNEQIKMIQWFGVLIIILSVMLINYRDIKVS